MNPFPESYLKTTPLLQIIPTTCIYLLPIFHLTFNDWTGYWMVFASFFCLLALIKYKVDFLSSLQVQQFKIVSLCLIAYTLAIFLSQLCRWSFYHRAYLDTSPFLYFIPVYLFVAWRRIDIGRWLQFIIPIVVIGAYWSTFYHHRELANPDWVRDHRLAPYFLDPLVFGQLTLTLGLMGLSTIQVYKSGIKNIALITWSSIGFFLGMYLSIQSGSRTGWLAIPLVLFLIVVIKLNWRLRKSIPIGILFAVLASFILYQTSPIIHDRINLAFDEIISYPWHGGIAPDTSVGLRITFQRLGWFYFSQSPIYGWGTGGYTSIKDAAEVLSFSSQFARDFVNSALFHNELMTQMVRYGMFGIAGYLLAVIVPLIIGIKNLTSNNPIVKRSALLLVCFIICQIISGLTDEFLNLKGMVAFYAYLVSTLLGTIIAFSNQTPKIESI
jgi:O-antigen ligase